MLQMSPPVSTDNSNRNWYDFVAIAVTVTITGMWTFAAFLRHHWLGVNAPSGMKSESHSGRNGDGRVLDVANEMTSTREEIPEEGGSPRVFSPKCPEAFKERWASHSTLHACDMSSGAKLTDPHMEGGRENGENNGDVQKKLRTASCSVNNFKQSCSDESFERCGTCRLTEGKQGCRQGPGSHELCTKPRQRYSIRQTRVRDAPLDVKTWHVWWDFENCQPTGKTCGALLVKRLGHVLRRQPESAKSCRVVIKIVGNTELLPRDLNMEEAGATVLHVARKAQKNVADTFILVELGLFWRSHDSSSGIVLVSGDGDFTVSLGVSNLLGFRTVVICPAQSQTAESLAHTAGTHLSWQEDVLLHCMRVQGALKPDLTRSEIKGSRSGASRSNTCSQCIQTDGITRHWRKKLGSPADKSNSKAFLRKNDAISSGLRVSATSSRDMIRDGLLKSQKTDGVCSAKQSCLHNARTKTAGSSKTRIVSSTSRSHSEMKTLSPSARRQVSSTCDAVIKTRDKKSVFIW